jgi:PilZ domain-containing protein
MKRKIGDRRAKPRFEIVGDLWGSVDTSISLKLRNLGRGGALLESPLPLEQDSIHRVTAVASGVPYQVQMRVRHAMPAATHAGGSRYLIGVEFLQLSPDLEEIIVRQVGLGDGSIPVEA